MKDEILIPSKRLFIFASILILALTLIYFLTKPQIQIQQQKALLASFKELAPELIFSADFLAKKENITFQNISAEKYRQDNLIFIKTSTFQGYSGEIILLIGIDLEKKALLGVRVLSHKETAGLGDKIELRKSNWILWFNNKDLNTNFKVKKDGGQLDAFTGATITPRAIGNRVGEVFSEVIKNVQ